MASICSEVGCNLPVFDCGIRAGGGDLPVLPTDDCNLQLCKKHHIPHHLMNADDHHLLTFGVPMQSYVQSKHATKKYGKSFRCVLLFSPF